MRILQAHVNLKFFRERFLRQYGFEQYRDNTAPALFYGCFKSMYRTVRLHKGPAVIVWCGSDSTMLLSNKEFISYLQRRKDIWHVAETSFISEDLKRCALKHEIYPFNIPSIDGLTSKPLGRNVYVYGSHIDPEFYGYSIVERLKKRLPDVEFITRYATPPDYSPSEELMKIYEDCCIGLRLVPHDGFSCTVAEMGLMGRKVVWNSEAPSAIPWKTDDDIVEAIQREYTRAGETDVELSIKMKEFLTIPEYVFDLDHYKNTSNKGKYYKLKPKTMKKVSVVMNSVNDDTAHFRSAIESYLQQEGVEVELIVSTVDNDPCVEIAKEKGVILVINKKPSIYGQLNAGIKLVTGDYFCFASGNDVATKKKLVTEVEILEKTGKSVCYSSFYVTDAGLQNPKVRSFYPYSFEKHLRGNFVSDCSLMRKEIIEKYGPFDVKHKNMAFYDFWLRVAEGEGEKAFEYNPIPTWYYRISDNSMHIARQRDAKALELNESLRKKMLSYHQ